MRRLTDVSKEVANIKVLKESLDEHDAYVICIKIWRAGSKYDTGTRKVIPWDCICRIKI